MQRKVATSLGTKSHGAHERFTNLFMENVNIGLHSLRSGATTAANSDVNDGIRKKHGRWISDSSKNGYVIYSLDSRISVSKKSRL